MRTISVSQINTYNSCAGKWKLKQEGLEPINNRLPQLDLGTLVHVGLANAMRSYHDTENPDYLDHPILRREMALARAKTAIREWEEENRPSEETVSFANPYTGELDVNDEFYEEWFDTFETANGLITRTLDNLEVPEKYSIATAGEKNEPLVEFRLEWPLPDGTMFVGYLDAVLIDRELDQAVVVDWKTKRTFIDESEYELDQQLPLYAHALHQITNLNVQFALLYQIKSRLPATPSVNKNGQLSRSKITCDWETYRDFAIGRYTDDPTMVEALHNEGEINTTVLRAAAQAVYGDMREKLQDAEFFRPLVRFIPSRITQIYWDNMVRSAQQIKEATEFPFALNTFTCRGCFFQRFCSALVQGSDPNDLIGAVYQYREKV